MTLRSRGRPVNDDGDNVAVGAGFVGFVGGVVVVIGVVIGVVIAVIAVIVGAVAVVGVVEASAVATLVIVAVIGVVVVIGVVDAVGAGFVGFVGGVKRRMTASGSSEVSLPGSVGPVRTAVGVSRWTVRLLSPAGRALYGDELVDELYDLVEEQNASWLRQVASALRQLATVPSLRSAARQADSAAWSVTGSD